MTAATRERSRSGASRIGGSSEISSAQQAGGIADGDLQVALVEMISKFLVCSSPGGHLLGLSAGKASLLQTHSA